MSTASGVSQSNKYKDIFIYGGTSILLLLLSSGFVYVIYGTIGFLEQIYVTVVTWIILDMMILPGFSKIQKMLKATFGKDKRSKCVGYLVYIVVPPLLFNGLLYQFKYLTGLFEFTLYILVPTSIVFLITITERIDDMIRKSYWIDVAFVLFYFYTFDARLFKNTFNVFGDPSYNILSLYMSSVLIYVLIFLRDRKDIGFNLKVTKKDIIPWISNLVVFTIIAIPIALATGFVTPRTTFESPLIFIVYFIGIFLTIAIIEELAFRGALLNFIEKITGNKMLALFISSIVFGFSHYNNATSWDMRYIGLATIAGIFYGLAYLKQKRLLPAVLIHTSVDTIWKYFFY